MKKNRAFFIAAVTIILTIFAALGIFRSFQPQVIAFNPQPDPPGFGMVGITSGQTIRISVVNTAESPAADSPPDPCRVVITFRDASGNLIRNANGVPIRRVVLLKGGESSFLDLNADDFIRENGGQRLQIRPEVRIQQASGNGLTPPDPCIPTVEVFNNANGRTQFVINALPAVQRSAVPTT
jgi:hypothetical protein